MKVLFMIPNLGHGGAEKVLVNLVNNMNLEKFDITVMTLYDEGINKDFLASNVKYVSCFHNSFKGISHLLKIISPETLYSRFVHEHYDAVISYLEGQTARIVSGCRDNTSKLISWIHVEQHTDKQAARTFRSIKEMDQCYLKFDRTVCVSEYVKKDFCNIVPVKNAIVLYNTIESDKIREQGKEKVESNLFSDDEFKLCGVGTLKKSKGFDRLITVHKMLRQAGYPVHTYLLGEGPEKRRLQIMVEDAHIEDSVTFLGYQTNPYKYVQKCDLFVCTSFAEGFSTAATEALIVGTPVCTVEVSGMKEMLGENNDYGVVTENTEAAFYDGLKSLLDNPERLDYYRKQAKIRGMKFSTENTVKAVEKFLIDIFESEN